MAPKPYTPWPVNQETALKLGTAAQRQEKRDRRANRFSPPLDTATKRLRAWMNMIFVDHGFFRLIHLNLHRVGEKGWRAAQPAPCHFRRFARRGIKTIVNLRGGREFGSWPLEVEACEKHGMALREFTLRSRGLPDVETLRALKTLFAEIEYPALWHCKSGADRAGFMSALYLALHEGRPVEEARKQLSLKYLHVKHSKTGVLDHFFDLYEYDSAKEPMDLWTWIETRYDPKAAVKSFHEDYWASVFVDKILARE